MVNALETHTIIKETQLCLILYSYPISTLSMNAL
ncbi:hypothetical protein EDB44_11265 [Vibrio crassostreae]|nr:hypothetical protein EDB44_11265 [Vibrio crassostreae]TCT82176.1 hypothetical protein EDB43_11265 [Vibrio crassostreae]